MEVYLVTMDVYRHNESRLNENSQHRFPKLEWTKSPLYTYGIVGVIKSPKSYIKNAVGPDDWIM